MNNLKLFLSIMISPVLLIAAACSPLMAAPTATAVPTAVPTAIPTVMLQPVDAARTLTVNGLERTYLLHVPSGLNSGQSVPLVFVFHGFEEDNNYARQYTGLDAIAGANGFIVAYPNGSGQSGSLSWNAGGCCGYAVANKVDETAFVRSMIADVGTLVTVDPKRIYAVGFSNGALLSYRLACEMSDTFAAVAPVAGVLLFDPCQPAQHVALIDVHGTKDTVVPFDGGGRNPVSGQPFPSVSGSVEAWAKLDGCTGTPQVEQNGLATHTTYGSCADGKSVELYTITGNGHSWPSPYVVPVSQIIWQFFAAHPKP